MKCTIVDTKEEDKPQTYLRSIVGGRLQRVTKIRFGSWVVEVNFSALDFSSVH